MHTWTIFIIVFPQTTPSPRCHIVGTVRKLFKYILREFATTETRNYDNKEIFVPLAVHNLNGNI